MENLTSRERRVLEARVLADQPMTLEELAAEFGVARVRVRQLEGRVLEKMGHRLQRLTETAMKTDDLRLLALEQEFIVGVECQFTDESNVDRWNRTIDAMIETSADSLDGIRAKARVACSNRLGDLDEVVVDPTAPHNDKTLENSILRDLIRLYDPRLERKGAVQALLVECTTGYANKEIDNDDRS
jgi:hypothetical protein